MSAVNPFLVSNRDATADNASEGISPSKFGLGIIGLPNTLSIRDVSGALLYVLVATTGNLTVEPPPAVNDDNADASAAAAPGLNADDMPDVIDPILSTLEICRLSLDCRRLFLQMLIQRVMIVRQ